MEIFADDVIIGDFKFSDYGLILASFNNNSESTEDLGMDHETIEEYIGHTPTPIFLGSQYSSKLKPTLTIIKNPCVHKYLYFTEHECRDLLRRLTGYYGYRRMQILQKFVDDEIFFNVRTVSVNYQKVMGKILGLILNMECDSLFAWTREMDVTISAKRNKEFNLYISTDDLHNYVYPIMSITVPSTLGSITIKNLSDNNWTTTIKRVSAKEQITVDSLHQTISSSSRQFIADDFNMHFPRFVPDKNTFIADQDIPITFRYILPRKVGFI